jgi:hypothetical protein
MRQQITAAALLACFMGGAAPLAFAQGSITQDPGRLTPGNLTTQQLGPSVDLPSVGTTVLRGTSGVGNTSGGKAPGYGASPRDRGPGSGAGFGGNLTGGDLSRGTVPGR